MDVRCNIPYWPLSDTLFHPILAETPCLSMTVDVTINKNYMYKMSFVSRSAYKITSIKIIYLFCLFIYLFIYLFCSNAS